MSKTLRGKARGGLHVLFGRGNTGKSLYARWLYECSTAKGRVLTMIDGDRTNATLASFVPEARRPTSTDDITAAAFLEDVTAEIIENGGNAVIDMGGGDLLFSNFADRQDLQQVLNENDIQLTLYYCVAGGRDDFEILKKHVAMGFTSDRTVLLLNEGLTEARVQGEDPFASLLAGKTVKECISNGAVIVRIPAVPKKTMKLADNLFISLHAAADGRVPLNERGEPHETARPLDFWRRFDIKRWLLQMSERHVNAGVSEWLP